MPHQRMMITIVAESLLEDRLVVIAEGCGATGYTITNARGKGRHGERKADWTHDRNVRMEIICAEEVAARIADQVESQLGADYKLIIFSHEVSVLRGGKF